MSEGELKKRAVHEAVIDLDDVKQFVAKDRALIIEIPNERYLVRMKDLFAWLDEAKQELLEALKHDQNLWDQCEYIEKSIKKWFGEAQNV